MPAPLVLGVDVGGTKVAVGALKDDKLFGPLERPTDITSAEALLDGIAAEVDAVRAEHGEPAAIGVGMPSQIDFETGRVVASVNIPLEGVSLKEVLGERFGVPVFVDNDANCAALAEAERVRSAGARPRDAHARHRRGRGRRDRRPHLPRGTRASAPSSATSRSRRTARPARARCPNRGCIEALCSGTALGRDALELAQDRPESVLGKVLAERGTVTRAATPWRPPSGRRAGPGADRPARDVPRRGLTGVVNTFEPELIVIGGGLSRASDLFLETRAHGDEKPGLCLPSWPEPGSPWPPVGPTPG